MSRITRENLRVKGRDAWRRLRGGELTPVRAALSVAIGLAIGVTPLYGLHIFLVLGVCLPLRLDAPVAYLAANISIPLFAPFIAFSEIQLGNLVQTGGWLRLEMGAMRTHGGAGAFARDLVLGTLVLSPSIAALGGTLAYFVVRRWKSHIATPLEEAIERVAMRYGPMRGATYYYVRGKLASDPVAGAMVALGEKEPLGEVVDVGAGRAQLDVLLLETKTAAKVQGFDWDAKKVNEAKKAAEGLPINLSVGDVRTHPIATCDTVLLVDVLHYLTDEEQDALLARAAEAARARVVVRDLDPDRGWRSAVGRIQEGVTTAIRFNRGARVRVRPIARIVEALEAKGFGVTVEPCWGGTPFANMLVVGRRAAKA